ncbi:hypothetical protein ACHAWF_016541 [Thalassiosira exigua]
MCVCSASSYRMPRSYPYYTCDEQVRDQQAEMEQEAGMRDGGAGGASRPLNRLEPFFLYEEDTEERRAKEREDLAKALKLGLASDDDVEGASNELLTRELLEGGITRDRASRLLDKLSAKAERGGTIRESLEELRRHILEEDEEDDDGEEEVGTKGPLDLSGVFRSSSTKEADGGGPVTASPASSARLERSGRAMPSWVDGEKREAASSSPSSPSSQEAFPAVASGGEMAASDVGPPPGTPFFQSQSDDVDADVVAGPIGGMFGTYEEQKLQRLANRVGASTNEEVEKLRKNMEALREAEEMANAQLSDDDFDIEAASARLGVDVRSLNLEDEDDDQILSVIGNRPVAASPSSDETRKAILEFNEDESDAIIVDATGHLKRMTDGEMSGKDRADIADDIFRAKTAGRRYDNEEAREADETAFREFLQMEEEAEKKLHLMGNETMPSGDVDVDAYADDIMSEMGPRPRIRGRREDFMSQEELFKERKKESVFGEDEDLFPVKGRGQQVASSSGGSAMPEWFRKEQEALGIDVDDLDDDDYEEARREWEREERQRKADEYLKRRGEGISISDVLGREYFGPMDEPEDDYLKSRSTFDSFVARKEMLLGYSELTAEDINNLVDYKDDPLATGYNSQLLRVQRPYSGYGAIFRLEGVLADMVGMHARAWKRVADAYGYHIQSSDEVRQASLYRPEDAVREVFHWTDDVLELRDITATHQEAFREAFDDWVEGGKVVAAPGERFSTSKKNTNAPNAVPSDEEMTSLYYLAWSKLAKNLDRIAPTNEQVYQGIMGGDWEDAVKDIFRWSSDPNEIYDIVVAYDEIMQADYRVLLEKYGIDLDGMDAQQEESQFGLDYPSLSLQDGVKEWLNTLHEVDMPCAITTHLESSQLDVVLDATGLAEYFSPGKRVSLDCNYSSRSELLGAALRVEQRPDKCVLFDNTPNSANEAHEVCMKSVSLADHYARYELLTADFSIGYAGDLDLISFVKLFDERTDLELELDLSSGLQKQQRQAKTAYWDE